MDQARALRSNGAAYSDERCRYLGGDPRVDSTGAATVSILLSGIQISVDGVEGSPDIVFHLPVRDIQQVLYEEQRLGLEAAEAEEDTLIGDNEWLVRHTAIVVMRDPEGVLRDGIRVRLGFRDAYYAQVFEKRCRQGFQLPPF